MPARVTRDVAGRIGLALAAGVGLAAVVLLSLGVDVVPAGSGDVADFLAHAAAYAGLTLLLLYVGPPRLRRSPLVLVLGVSLLGAVLELAQPAFGRDAQWSDLVADVSGAALAAAAVLLTRRPA